ncbi:hypothetical protein CCGE525_05585 [Rhizobium jaguaris]|uniref:Uncharacterized protein n=1 Tax=Rhizobium jaguaris TaxID=1312183 RepID=A0A387FRG9_9HYPH|nr:hypothetical protein CCGE525_05585 [Rhizobium jaguaris]
MSRKSAQRFCDSDMRKFKSLKRKKESERSRSALAPHQPHGDAGGKRRSVSGLLVVPVQR